MIRVKICGITQYEDAKVACRCGVDALGFIFYAKSPRYIVPQKAREIIAQLPPFVNKVGVFVNESLEEIHKIVHETGIDTLQLHGNESPEFADQVSMPVVKALGVGETFDFSLINSFRRHAILLDTAKNGKTGGTGMTFNWEIAKKACEYSDRIILAGGINIANIEEATSSVAPYGIDLNSGVEIRPGIKNPQKVKAILKKIKN